MVGRDREGKEEGAVKEEVERVVETARVWTLVGGQGLEKVRWGGGNGAMGGMGYGGGGMGFGGGGKGGGGKGGGAGVGGNGANGGGKNGGKGAVGGGMAQYFRLLVKEEGWVVATGPRDMCRAGGGAGGASMGRTPATPKDALAAASQSGRVWGRRWNWG